MVVVDGVLVGWLGSQSVSCGWQNSRGRPTRYHQCILFRPQLHLVPADHSGTQSYLTHTNTDKSSTGCQSGTQSYVTHTNTCITCLSTFKRHLKFHLFQFASLPSPSPSPPLSLSVSVCRQTKSTILYVKQVQIGA